METARRNSLSCAVSSDEGLPRDLVRAKKMPVSAPRRMISCTASRAASVAASETSIARTSFLISASTWGSRAIGVTSTLLGGLAGCQRLPGRRSWLDTSRPPPTEHAQRNGSGDDGKQNRRQRARLAEIPMLGLREDPDRGQRELRPNEEDHGGHGDHGFDEERDEDRERGRAHEGQD